jgi:hypothetical protein
MVSLNLHSIDKVQTLLQGLACKIEGIFVQKLRVPENLTIIFSMFRLATDLKKRTRRTDPSSEHMRESFGQLRILSGRTYSDAARSGAGKSLFVNPQLPWMFIMKRCSVLRRLVLSKELPPERLHNDEPFHSTTTDTLPLASVDGIIQIPKFFPK